MCCICRSSFICCFRLFLVFFDMSYILVFLCFIFRKYILRFLYDIDLILFDRFEVMKWFFVILFYFFWEEIFLKIFFRFLYI